MSQGIVETLKQNSDILNDVENAFDRWVLNRAADIDITCFYEELELPIVGVVVDKNSAKLGGFSRIGIHANHMNVTKYASPDDVGYKRVKQEILRWLAGLQLEDDQKECLESLWLSEILDKLRDINPPIDETCNWIFRHPNYLD